MSKGKLLGQGENIFNMMQFCFYNKLNKDNSILEVEFAGDNFLTSRHYWKIYEKIEEPKENE